MQYRHADKNLKEVDENAEFDGGFAPNLVKAFRARMQSIEAATNENDLRGVKSYRFE